VILYYAHLAWKAALLTSSTSYTLAPQQSARYQKLAHEVNMSMPTCLCRLSLSLQNEIRRIFKFGVQVPNDTLTGG